MCTAPEIQKDVYEEIKFGGNSVMVGFRNCFYLCFYLNYIISGGINRINKFFTMLVSFLAIKFWGNGC